MGDAVEERLAELESSVEALPEKTDIVSAGDFPGSFKIPGTDAAMKIGGQVRFTGINSFDALGSEDRFVTSSIPIAGTEEAGKESRVTYISSPSRINFDMRTPTGVGSMRAFVEADYAGPGNSFRLRHAFGQWQKFLIGQTWSTFADPEAEPDGIDFEGLNAISLFRKPQVRWTTPFGKQLLLAGDREPRPRRDRGRRAEPGPRPHRPFPLAARAGAGPPADPAGDRTHPGGGAASARCAPSPRKPPTPPCPPEVSASTSAAGCPPGCGTTRTT